MISRQQLSEDLDFSSGQTTMSLEDVRAIFKTLDYLSERARYRDFYDIYLILDTHKIDLNEVIELLAQKEIRQPITKANVRKNWEIVQSQKMAEMEQIYYSRSIDDREIVEMIHNLPFTKIIK